MTIALVVNFCSEFAKLQISLILLGASALDSKDCDVALLDKKSNMLSSSFMASVMVSGTMSRRQWRNSGYPKEIRLSSEKKKREILLNMKIYAVGDECVKDTTRNKINIDIHLLVIASYN